jgi:carboxyl-terminal processing protease
VLPLKQTRQVWFVLAAALVVSSLVSSCSLASEPKAPQKDPAVESVFAEVYHGQFAEAEKAVNEQLKDNPPAQIAELSKVLAEYNAIKAHRDSLRKTAYQKQLAELDTYRNPATAPKDANGTHDVNDVKDPNAVFRAFTVVVRANELADDSQKKALLADPFVKTVLDRSKVRCAKFEAEGEWLESLVDCWSKLSALYKDDKQYRDYGEDLTDKEIIKLSLQDSPCEKSTDRYEGVTKDLFTRTIKRLDNSYVNIIDYTDMATKALKRCKLLAEVVHTVPSLQAKYLKGGDVNDYSAWIDGIDKLTSEAASTTLGMSRDKFFDIYDKTLALNDSTIKLPREVVIVQFSEAALASLDPYTNLIWPQQVEEFKKNMTNEFSGIGVEISKADGPLKVASLLPDTPAYNSGLDADDVIQEINGESTKDMPIGCAVKTITGPSGTSVTLTILHKGDTKPVKLTIKRARIVVPTVRGWQRDGEGQWRYMLDPVNGIGYVRVTGFSEKTAPDFEDALNNLEKQGLRGLIIDLRFNPGGYLETAVAIVDKFVKKGLIVKTQPRFGWAHYESAHEEGTHPDYPIAVLINSGSASASEIVSGALQDPMHKRAILVGTRTYGKGSVQTIDSIGGGAELKYTMAYYHLPSGQRVEGRTEMEKQGRKDWGVGPDVEVEMNSEELKKMIDVQRDNDVLVKADHDKAKAVKKYSAPETLESDPQLAIADLVIKSKLIETKALAMKN